MLFEDGFLVCWVISLWLFWGGGAAYLSGSRVFIDVCPPMAFLCVLGYFPLVVVRWSGVAAYLSGSRVFIEVFPASGFLVRVGLSSCGCCGLGWGCGVPNR